nr:enolase C-terminal domain-like protein [Halalkalicoccus paucihalophilus]
MLEHMSRDVPWGDEIVKHDFEVSNGTLEVPDKPGLGVEFDAEAAREHPGEPKDSHSLFDAEGALKRP